MNDINLSYIIDHVYQLYIEKNEIYIDIIYDLELLHRNNLLLENDVLSRFKDSLILPYKFDYKPYKLNDKIIHKMCEHIEITQNRYNDSIITRALFNTKLKDKSIIYYYNDKLLLNNYFDDNNIYHDKDDKQEITTFDILTQIRKYYDKRN
jgi:hypothetical protein